MKLCLHCLLYADDHVHSPALSPSQNAHLLEAFWARHALAANQWIPSSTLKETRSALVSLQLEVVHLGNVPEEIAPHSSHTSSVAVLFTFISCHALGVELDHFAKMLLDYAAFQTDAAHPTKTRCLHRFCACCTIRLPRPEACARRTGRRSSPRRHRRRRHEREVNCSALKRAVVGGQYERRSCHRRVLSASPLSS